MLGIRKAALSVGAHLPRDHRRCPRCNAETDKVDVWGLARTYDCGAQLIPGTHPNAGEVSRRGNLPVVVRTWYYVSAVCPIHLSKPTLLRCRTETV